MRLNLTVENFLKIVDGVTSQKEGIIDSIVYDSRKIVHSQNALFVAIHTKASNGHLFINDAYQKGIRLFLVDENINVQEFPEALFIKVEDTLNALEALAIYSRAQFKGEVMLVSGIIGKTTFKEWIYNALNGSLSVQRSPKSYNSHLGVLLSIIQLQPADLAIIEVKPHADLTAQRINEIVRPTVGVWCSASHSRQALPVQFIDTLFQGVTCVYSMNLGHSELKTKWCQLPLMNESSKSQEYNWNASLVKGVVQSLYPNIASKIDFSEMPPLALRMEMMKGINGILIVNDTYNFDLEHLYFTLENVQQLKGNRKLQVVICLDDSTLSLKSKLEELLKPFEINNLFIGSNVDEVVVLPEAMVLIKGTKKSQAKALINRLKEKQHKTYVTINQEALRKNILAHRELLRSDVKLMAMVKASSYGAGLQEMVHILDQNQISYFGVAYADEGVQIREAGSQLPIMVMNAEEDSFASCIENNLEPAIYDFDQLDEFIKECILHEVEQYPIHLKFDTGMHRLGFEHQDIAKLKDVLSTQPEVKVASVYSHLADADNLRDKRFTEHQLQQFQQVVEVFKQFLSYSFDAHILNSSGIANYPKHCYTMARIGIGMFGISSNVQLNRKLEPVLGWYSKVSQVKLIKPGHSVGYSRTFKATQNTEIATIPVGYADGYSRSLSNGKGHVFIKGKVCPIVGRVCMDMIMVDVTGLNVKRGEEVELIGPHLTLEKMAELQQTIPYEVMTSISQRVHRIYLR